MLQVGVRLGEATRNRTLPRTGGSKQNYNIHFTAPLLFVTALLSQVTRMLKSGLCRDSCL